MSQQVISEAARRRTFAIISHPDAGKTTLTEKFLLYAGAITSGGAVKAHEGRRAATSDWMDMEQKRGISITSTALNFPYRDHDLNLLDTPGHRDFSEDTYRVLSAVDAVVMVLDSAKGIEPQTLKLFEVCRSRNLPVITFLNKLDRPGMEPLELLDQIEEQIGLRPTPATWPVGSHGDLRGVIDRRTESSPASPAPPAARRSRPRRTSTDRAAAEEGAAWTQGDRRHRAARRDRRRRRPAVVPRRRVDSRCSPVRRSPTSASVTCSTRSSTSLRRRRPASTSTASRATSTNRVRRSCSRCRRTWTATTATASRSPASARAGSTAGW